MEPASASETVAQYLARCQLRDPARRLMFELGNIYTTPRQGRMLEAYIRRHIFIHLEITTLSLEGTMSHNALSNVAAEVVNSFFDDGVARELGWDFLRPEREREVRTELHGVVARLLLLPAKKIEWRAEWTEELRKAADDPRANSTAVTQAAQTEAGEEEAAANRERHHHGDDHDGDGEADIYSPEQASMWMAIQEENVRRERQKVSDAKWAAEVESQIARARVEEEDMEDIAAGYDGSDDEETLFGDDDLDDGIRLPGAAKEADGEDAKEGMLTATTAGEQGVLAVEMGVHEISITQTEPGIVQGATRRQNLMMTQRETGLYDCTVCKEPFVDAIALSEHYLEAHIED